MAVGDAQLILNRLHDRIRIAQHTRRRRAHLDVELADGIAIVQSVKGGNLIDTHRRHLQHLCNLVHDADGAESVLSLANVEQRHHRSLLVLRRVALENFIDEAEVLVGEFERDGGIVFG